MIEAAGGVTPYVFGDDGNLPAGITLQQNGPTTAILAGTFAAAQSFDAIITVMDAAGQQASAYMVRA